ncbi:thiol reductant ABC exporter subunit CydD [Rhodobacterales bacterium]|nr:thiol reductant ABC exporter subunit CydD [Rhodobacterales bacterium]
MKRKERSEIALEGETKGIEAIGLPQAAERKSLRDAGVRLALSDLLWIAQAGLVAFVLGTILDQLHVGEAIQAADLSGFVLMCAVAIAGVACLRSWLQFSGLNEARRTAILIRQRTRKELLGAATQSSPVASFPSSGAFAAHVSEQVDLLGPYYSNFHPQFARLKLVPIGILIATLCYSWMAGLILIICGPLIPVFMALIGMRAKAASERQQEELTRLSGLLLDRVRGLETLTLFGAVGRTKADVAEAGERFRTGTMRVLKIAFLSSTVLELFSALGIAFSAVYVGFSLLGDLQIGTWGAPLGYTSGLFILLLAPEFFAPLRAYAAAYHDRAAGLAAREKLTALSRKIDNGASEAPVPVGDGAVDQFWLARPVSVCFQNVTVSLGERAVFEGLDISIEPGETVFLEGPSGSGKTTLLDCLLGFHRPCEGKVVIGEMDASACVQTLRQGVMWLGQAPRLFHGSVKANLLRAVQDPDQTSDDALWVALRLAGAADLVRRLPHGLSTQIGEDGFGLSVGEIRRVALARAALRQGAGLFLADEPTAGLDEETAGDVIEGLKSLSANRTAIIATHDPRLLALPGRRIDVGQLSGAFRKEAVS